MALRQLLSGGTSSTRNTLPKPAPPPTVAPARTQRTEVYYQQPVIVSTPAPKPTPAPAPAPARLQPSGRTLTAENVSTLRQALNTVPTQSSGGSGGGGGYSSGGYGGGYGGGGGGGYSSGGGYGGGGGGGATVTVGGLPVGDVTSPVTGFASRYLPGMIADILANPGVIGRDTLTAMGIGGDVLGERFADSARFLANQLTPLLYGETPVGQIPKGGDVVNRLHDILKGFATPGGGEIGAMKLLERLLTETSKTSSDKQTILSALAVGKTPAEQAAIIGDLIDSISNWLPNPYFAEAMRSWRSTQADKYIGATAAANGTYTKSYADWLRANGYPT